MNALLKTRTSRLSATFVYVLVSAAVFLGLFLIIYAPEARLAGSWKYVVNIGDEYGYWAYARGAAENPPSDGNPFYFEELGKRQPVPYLTCNFIGWLSKWFRVPVLFFFPFWKIGMPLLLWWSLFFSLTRVWKQPSGPSAVFSLFVLVSTLFINGQMPHILLRFSRPIDSLWIAVIWISYAVHAEQLKKRLPLFVLCGLVILTAWLNPFLGLLGALVTIGELLWQAIGKRNKPNVSKLLIIISAAGLGMVSVFSAAHLSMAQNPWVKFVLEQGYENLPKGMEKNSFILYGLICLLVLFRKLLTRKPLDRLDRLMLFVFLIDPISTHTQLILKNNYQFANHRYYYWIIELSCLAGWTTQIFKELRGRPDFRKWETLSVAMLVLAQCFILTNPKTYFLNVGPLVDRAVDIPDNAVRFFSAIPSIMFLSWCLYRMQSALKSLWAYGIVASITLTALFFAFQFWPQFRGGENPDFPFGGAYHWLNNHAKPNEVVLTVSPNRLATDYLILYTNQRAYLNPYGDTLTGKNSNPENVMRFTLYFRLLTQEPLTHLEPFEKPFPEALRYPRLDYVLIDLPSPFFDSVASHLKKWAQEVYRDQRCLLWKVRLSR